MCGFFVIINHAGEPDREALRIGTAALAHRGPDDETFVHRDTVGIGFRRLSIVDLETGNQPLWNEAKDIALVCNGEIYNSASLRKDLESKGHSFATHSDCEVLVHLYEEFGSSFIERLEGMFAFVLIDFERKQVLSARDYFGIKPLYYHATKERILFASEIGALTKSGLVQRDVNTSYIQDSFLFGFPIGQTTLIKNVYALAPASFVQLDMRMPRPPEEIEYWRPEFCEGAGLKGIFSPTNTTIVRQGLTDAVRSHRMSDVAVGSYLSGGIDSSILALLLRQQQKDDTVTYSIAFDDPLYSEEEVFKQTIQFAGLHGIVEECNANVIEHFPRVIRSLEMPLFSPTDVPMTLLAKRVRTNGMKVVLSGEGSDELFGGYAGFPWIQMRRALLTPSLSAHKATLSAKALGLLAIHPSLHFLYQKTLEDDAVRICNALGFYPPWLSHWLRRHDCLNSWIPDWRLDSIENHPSLLSIGQELQKQYPKLDPFNAGLYAELKTRLPNFILHRADRTSMSQSVEARVPFLDKNFASAVYTLSPLAKALGFKEKALLRAAFKNLLPPHLRKTRKFGYSAPNEWLWKQTNDVTRHYLSEETTQRHGYFPAKRIAEFSRELSNARGEWDFTLHEKANFLTGVISTHALLEVDSA